MAGNTSTVRDKDALRPVMLSVFRMVEKGLARGPVVVTLSREKRTLDQNSKMWPMLADVAEQVEWFNQKFSKEDWKDILSAAWAGQRLVPGIDGKLVALGVRTSQLEKEPFSELIQVISVFGDEKEVVWSEKAKAIYQEYREAG